MILKTRSTNLMKIPEIALALGRVIVAAAWADGEIQGEEIDCLKDLLFQLPELDDQGWAELETVLDKPVTAGERKRFVRELKSLLVSRADIEFVFYALEQIVRADGVVTQSEKALLDDIKAGISDVAPNELNSFERLLHQPIQTRRALIRDRLSKAQDLEDFISSSAVDLRQRLGKSAVSLQRVRKFCLAAMLIARIVRCDDRSSSLERDTGQKLLAECWNLKDEEAGWLTDLCFGRVLGDMDLVRVCRSFYNITKAEERLDLLRILFQIAVADHSLSEEEMREILDITANLKISQGDFQSVYEACGMDS